MGHEDPARARSLRQLAHRAGGVRKADRTSLSALSEGAGLGSLIGNRLAAQWTALASNDRSQALKASTRSCNHSRDSWMMRAPDLVDGLQRYAGPLAERDQDAAAELAVETMAWRPSARSRRAGRCAPSALAPRPDGLVGELAKGLEGDWPYLAF